MTLEFAPQNASPGDFGVRPRALSPCVERVLRRIFQGDRGAGPAETAFGTFPGPQAVPDRFDVSDALIAIFAPDGPEARSMKSVITGAGGTAMIIPQFDVPEIWLRAYVARLTCCIVGHDFADADEAVDFCLRLRAIAPELVTVLTLKNIKCHDFSAARMPICDVTLRRPVARNPLFLGLQAARDNRAAFDMMHRGTAGFHQPGRSSDAADMRT